MVMRQGALLARRVQCGACASANEDACAGTGDAGWHRMSLRTDDVLVLICRLGCSWLPLIAMWQVQHLHGTSSLLVIVQLVEQAMGDGTVSRGLRSLSTCAAYEQAQVHRSALTASLAGTSLTLEVSRQR